MKRVYVVWPWQGAANNMERLYDWPWQVETNIMKIGQTLSSKQGQSLQQQQEANNPAGRPKHTGVFVFPRSRKGPTRR